MAIHMQLQRIDDPSISEKNQKSNYMNQAQFFPGGAIITIPIECFI